MLFHTPTQFVILVLVLIAGWFFGLASHPGGRKWRVRYEDERDAHGVTRKDLEARLTERDRRIAELERENAALERSRAASTVAVPQATAATAATVARPAAAPAGWTAADGDDLSRIRGVDAPLADRMRASGIHHFRDVEAVDEADYPALERHLGLANGTIAADRWREQAMLLREGNTDEWGRRFGTV